MNQAPTRDLSVEVGATVETIQEIDAETLTLEEDDVQLEGTQLIIAQSVFEGVDVEDERLSITTEAGIIELTLDTTDKNNPHFICDTSATYQGEDLTFEVEPLEGELSAIDNAITEEEYHYDNGTLTLEASYFEALLEDEPDRETIMLGVQFTQDGDTTITYLFIDLP